jgi:hypothetical protein
VPEDITHGDQPFAQTLDVIGSVTHGDHPFGKARLLERAAKGSDQLFRWARP